MNRLLLLMLLILPTISYADNYHWLDQGVITAVQNTSGTTVCAYPSVIKASSVTCNADGSATINGTGGGSGTPGGATTQVQYNSSGSFAGNSAFTFNSSTGAVTATSFITAATNTPQVQFYPILSGDTHWIWGMNADGDGTNNDHLYLSEGTTVGSSNRIDIAPGGNVGIGLTSAPSATLFSLGYSGSGGSTTHNAFNIDSNGNITNLGGIQANINAATVDLTNAGAAISFGNNSGYASSNVKIHTENSTGYVTINPGSDVEAMRVNYNGYTGFGTTDPRGIIDANGTIYANAGLHTDNDLGGITSVAGINLDPTGDGPLISLSAGRFVGIGTSSPATLLDVAGVVSAADIKLSPTQTVTNCASSGTVTSSQPNQGANYKNVIMYSSACLGAATYTYPIAFFHNPQILSQGLTGITSASTVSVTVTGTTSTGFIELSGY